MLIFTFYVNIALSKFVNLKNYIYTKNRSAEFREDISEKSTAQLKLALTLSGQIFVVENLQRFVHGPLSVTSLRVSISLFWSECFRIMKCLLVTTDIVIWLAWYNRQSHNNVLPVAKAFKCHIWFLPQNHLMCAQVCIKFTLLWNSKGDCSSIQ